LRGPDDELVVDGLTRLRDGDDPDAGITQERAVGGGDFASARIPGIQVTQLDAQDRALQAIHPAVPPDDGVLVFLAGPTMVAHLAHSIRQLVVGGDHRPGVTAGPQVLSRVEAEASGVAGGAGPLAAA